MNISIIRFFAISIAFSCLFSGSVNAAEDILFSKSKTILAADIDGNGISDKVITTFFNNSTLFVDDYQAKTCKTVLRKFIRFTLYLNGQKNGRVIFEANYFPSQVLQLNIGTDLNRDGRKDLVVYIGGETYTEKTYLLQKPEGFKAVYAGGQDSPTFSFDN